MRSHAPVPEAARFLGFHQAAGEDLAAALDVELEAQRILRDRLLCADPDVLQASVRCFGSARAAARWLTTPEILLNGGRPVEEAGSFEGRLKVLGVLARLEQGMFSP
jgi:hypothetical protein